MSTADLLVGFVIGALVSTFLMYLVVRSVRRGLADELLAKEAAVDEIRREAAADRETNRRLRHEMHGVRTGRAISSLAEPQPESDRRSNVSVDLRDGATPMGADDASEAVRLRSELARARLQIADQESKLKRYREALTEIRLSLESSDPLTSVAEIANDVESPSQANASSGAA